MNDNNCDFKCFCAKQNKSLIRFGVPYVLLLWPQVSVWTYWLLVSVRLFAKLLSRADHYAPIICKKKKHIKKTKPSCQSRLAFIQLACPVLDLSQNQLGCIVWCNGCNLLANKLLIMSPELLYDSLWSDQTNARAHMRTHICRLLTLALLYALRTSAWAWHTAGIK